ILDPALCTDQGVISKILRGKMALQIRSLDPVFQLHYNLTVILDIHFFPETTLVYPGIIRFQAGFSDLAIRAPEVVGLVTAEKIQRTKSGNFLRVRTGQIMYHINIMRALLKEQRISIFSCTMPVMKIEMTPKAHKMPYPGCLNISDLS